jgi:hypothetical protein
LGDALDERITCMHRAGLVVLVVVLVAGCSSNSHSDSPHGPLEIAARHDVPMQNGNLVQKTLHAGAKVEALCFDRAPSGYPGPVAKVRSGKTVGYVIVEADGEPSFNLRGSEIEARLPTC